MPNLSYYKSSKECQNLIEKFSILFPRYNSVRKLVTFVNSKIDKKELRLVQLQRVQNLLDEDLNKSIRNDTFKSLDYALGKITDLEINKNFQKNINDLFKVEIELNDDETLAIKNISEQKVIPFQVVKFYVEKNIFYKKNTNLSDQPDWSWQEKAVRSVTRDLRENVGKYGVIIPTGGGKTRIANKIIINWVGEKDGKILWVTHRNILLNQAENSLVNLMDELSIKRNEQLNIRKKCIYASNHGYQQILNSEEFSLIIVDEAHHVAASTYHEIMNQTNTSVVMLTATPNRYDGKELGIDKISYQISYKDLFKKKCIIEPIFEEPYYINEDFHQSKNYDDRDLCKELAKYVLKRLSSDINKCLICVRKISYVENIFEELKSELLNNLEEHRLDSDQIQFVHGSKNSKQLTTNEFLKINTNEKNGILVATKDLIGEGFDDPFIDSVFITYPSKSITDLMQMGGRALRHSPGKNTARIIQVHQSKLAYHFNNRWLYQDISDNLRPRLIDITYRSLEERELKLIKLMEKHNVSEVNFNKILYDLKKIGLRGHFRMVLLGHDFHGQLETFESKCEFFPMLINDDEYGRFKEIFNEVSFHNDVSEVYDYKEYFKIKGISETNKIYSFYTFLLFALNKSRKEINNQVPSLDKRNYFQTASQGNTWIKYVNFYHDDQGNEIESFIADSLNREEILNLYSSDEFYSIIKIYYPVHSSRAFLLKKEQDLEFNNLKSAILNKIKASEADQFDVIERIKNSQTSINYSPVVFNNIYQFLNDSIYTNNYLILNNDTNFIDN